ncbi:translation initiation factor IF-2-like [Cervus elaphus]|uniref:translation initiation factor IF-2-like n=1 Tax=Cervus elaphus TaxID=9860 RepID=UPI001CC2739F|nr:translation initiation factor IF-2-like [Cervus elaphus]
MRRKFVGSRTCGRHPPASCRPVPGGRCAHTFPVRRTGSPGRAPISSGTQTDTGLSPGLSRNSRFLQRLPVRGSARAGGGGPRVLRVKGRVRLPPPPAPPGLCDRRTHRLPPPGFRSGTSAAGASRLARPPASPAAPAASLRSGGARAAPRPGAGSEAKPGRGPGLRGRRAWEKEGAPLLAGPCQCFALGAACGWGSFPAGPGARAPPASGPFGGSGRPAELPRPGAGSRGRGRRGGGRGRGRGLGARWPVIG